MKNEWLLLEKVIKAPRILLYGKPGTGKTYSAMTMGTNKSQMKKSITLTPETSATDLLGHYILVGDDGMEWNDGIAIETFPIHRDLPSVYVEKSGGSWAFSGESLAEVPTIYAETFSSISLWIQNVLPSMFSKPIVWDIRLWQVVWLSALVVTGWFFGWLFSSSSITAKPKLATPTSKPQPIFIALNPKSSSEHY